jgi:hypothetical protein
LHPPPWCSCECPASLPLHLTPLGWQIFHEGLKSWSCCNTVNKPVLDFDEFMAIAVCGQFTFRVFWCVTLDRSFTTPLAQGCTRGVHSAEAPKVEPSATSSTTPNRSLTMTETADGKEVYTSPAAARSRPQEPAKQLSTRAAPVAQPAPAKKVEEEDDLEATVPEGTPCQRAGCKVTFVSDEENRIGDGSGAKCVYHSGAVREPGPHCIPLMARLH